MSVIFEVKDWQRCFHTDHAIQDETDIQARVEEMIPLCAFRSFTIIASALRKHIDIIHYQVLKYN